MEKSAEKEIYEKLGPVFQDILFVDNPVLTPQTTARDIPGWDSLNNIRLMVAIEKAFGIRFQTSEVMGLANLGALVSLIAAKVGRS
ncbi:MAG: acyl carrier protein [Magnetococcales bacterium]|nr:acyl carrier protein [Magnetococcales bacterium]MBF0156250.1 acyl carrier protein [Magnetococcales bacterium]